MRRFEGLEDKEIIACYVSAYRENGLDDVVFEKNIAQMKSQKEEELIQLSQELEKLEIVNNMDKEAFYKQVEIYLLATQENISMPQAAELFVKLEEARDKGLEGEGVYDKIIASMRLPKYSTTDEKPQREKPQREVEKLSENIEWIQDSGDVKASVANKEFTTDSYRVAYDEQGNLKTLKRKGVSKK